MNGTLLTSEVSPTEHYIVISDNCCMSPVIHRPLTWAVFLAQVPVQRGRARTCMPTMCFPSTGVPIRHLWWAYQVSQVSCSDHKDLCIIFLNWFARLNLPVQQQSARSKTNCAIAVKEDRRTNVATNKVLDQFTSYAMICSDESSAQLCTSIKCSLLHLVSAPNFRHPNA